MPCNQYSCLFLVPDDNALELGLGRCCKKCVTFIFSFSCFFFFDIGIGIGILALVCVMVLCVILCCVCWPRKKGEYGPKKEEKRDAKKKENEGKSRLDLFPTALTVKFVI